MQAEVTGTIVEMFPMNTRKNGMKVAEFVVDEQGDFKYPNLLKCQVTSMPKNEKDYADIVHEIPVGSVVKMTISVNGRKWDSPAKGTMYFTDLRVIGKIDIISRGTASPSINAQTPAPASAPSFTASEPEGDLPF